jgi:hypothetical protein
MSASWKRPPADSTTVRGKESTSALGDEMTSELGERRCGYPDKCQQAHLEKERTAYPEDIRRVHPAIGDDKRTKHLVDVKSTHKCTD